MSETGSPSPDIIQQSDPKEKKHISVEKRKFQHQWEGWRWSMPPEALRTIPPTAERTFDKMAANREKLVDIKPQSNRIATVISAWDAQDVLPDTIKETAEAMKQNGLNGEIFVVLNNGGGNTKESLDFEDANIDHVIHGQTIALEQTDEQSKSTPRKIELDQTLDDEVHGISLVIIDQQPENDDNQGKIRGLRDITNFMSEQAQQNGYCPQFLEMKDAETRCRLTDNIDDDLSGPTQSLQKMIAATQGGKKIIGAKNLLKPYSEDGQPLWNEQAPPIQESINILHGTDEFQWLPGGEYIGDFKTITAIMETMAQEMPGMRIEDYFLTTCARLFGQRTETLTEVVHSNRCPGQDQPEAAQEQMERWFKGKEAVDSYVGPELSKIHTNSTVLTEVFTNTKAFMKNPRDINIVHLVKGLLPNIKIKRKAKEEPDIIEGSATW